MTDQRIVHRLWVPRKKDDMDYTRKLGKSSASGMKGQCHYTTSMKAILFDFTKKQMLSVRCPCYLCSIWFFYHICLLFSRLKMNNNCLNWCLNFPILWYLTVCFILFCGIMYWLERKTMNVLIDSKIVSAMLWTVILLKKLINSFSIDVSFRDYGTKYLKSYYMMLSTHKQFFNF